jgi:hypothetical protein
LFTVINREFGHGAGYALDSPFFKLQGKTPGADQVRVGFTATVVIDYTHQTPVKYFCRVGQSGHTAAADDSFTNYSVGHIFHRSPRAARLTSMNRWRFI